MFDPHPAAPGAVTVLQSAVAATNNSAWLLTGPHTLFTFEVTGTWVGELLCQGYLTSTGTVTDIPVYTLNGARVSKIIANGIYQVDVSGFVGVRTRVNAYTSGSITVNGKLSREDVRRAARITEIFHGVTASIAALGSDYVIDSSFFFDLSGFAYFRVGCLANSASDFTVRYAPRARPDSGGQTYSGLIDILPANLRGHSDLVEPLGRGARFNILNSDAGSAHTYTVTIWGIS